MRSILLALALLPISTPYAAPIPLGGDDLAVGEDGLRLEPPWVLTVAEDENLPDGLSIGGQPLAHLEVHPTGIVVLNGDGFDATAPRPLNQLVMDSAIAPFWAALEPGACPDGSVGAVTRAEGRASLRIVWRDMPLAGCPAGGESATFSAELSWDEQGVIRRVEFRYESLSSETLVVEPRAGLRLQERGEVLSLFELLPDPESGLLRGRAKLLFEGASDGEAGAWTIELGDDGQIEGELEPGFVDENGQPRSPDGWRASDNCPVHFNPLQEDLDGDGKGDVCDGDADGDEIFEGDNCPLAANRGQVDTDGDGDGDACDSDDDGDGWPDRFDRCPQRADPSNHDLDGDGVGDACDPDPDGDDEAARLRAPLRVDTCPFVFDPARADLDRDGIGDACDLLPAQPCRITCHWQRDADGDGVGDPMDICPTVRDPEQVDRDGDGVGDACDPDDNGDGLIDALQIVGRFGRALTRPEVRVVPAPVFP